MTSGWSDARDWLITLPTAQELAADIGAFGKGPQFKREKMKFIDERDRFLGEYKAAIEPMDLPPQSNALRRYAEEARQKIIESFYIDWSTMQTRAKETSAMIGMRQYVTAMKAPPKPPEPKVTPIIDRILCVGDLLAMNRIPADSVSIVLPEDDWLILRSEIEIYYNVKPKDDGSSLRYCGIEFLRGSAAPNADRSVWFKEVLANSVALTEEIIRCLSGGRVSKLPERTGGDRVSASPDSSGKVGVASSPAIGNNRNGNSARHIPDQLDVVSAKAAIAAYARDKKLPGSVSLAQLRELDNSIAAKNPVQPIYMGIDLASDIQGDGHSLSSEPLSRAINQLNVAEDGRAHRDFIGAAAQGFAEMLDAGDAPAHRKR